MVVENRMDFPLPRLHRPGKVRVVRDEDELCVDLWQDVDGELLNVVGLDEEDVTIY